MSEEQKKLITEVVGNMKHTVKIGYRTIPGNAKGKKEYIVEYWEEKEKKIEM